MIRWYFFVLLLITLASGALRFSALPTPDKIVGDEVYFANFAHQYLLGKPVHDAHPPLGKILMAGGIAVFDFTPFGWRFVTALFGTLLIPAAYCFATGLTRSKGIGLAFAGLLGLDGLFFVESRLGLMNVLYLFFFCSVTPRLFMYSRYPTYSACDGLA